MPDGYPWGKMTVSDSCPTNMPDTGMRPPGVCRLEAFIQIFSGVTRYYEWTIARSTLAPDGVPVNVMLVNGEFPGPMIEANWGDWQARHCTRVI
jgi:hypothetical protein